MNISKSKLHVAFNMSIAESIRRALRASGQDGNVIGLADDLSFGPIDAPTSAARAEWVGNVVGYERSEVIAESTSFWQKIQHSDASVIAWVNRNDSADYCGFLELIQIRGDAPFVVIDATESEFTNNRGQRFAPRSLGIVSPEQMIQARLFEQERSLTLDEIDKYKRSWAQMRIENAPLRIVTQGSLVSAPIDYFDKFLMRQISGEWQRGARVVGETLGQLFSSAESPHVGDIWLWGRVLALAETGELEIDGDASEMQKAWVRRASASPA